MDSQTPGKGGVCKNMQAKQAWVWPVATDDLILGTLCLEDEADQGHATENAGDGATRSKGYCGWPSRHGVAVETGFRPIRLYHH
jgi:hypothetical protein